MMDLVLVHREVYGSMCEEYQMLAVLCAIQKTNAKKNNRPKIDTGMHSKTYRLFTITIIVNIALHPRLSLMHFES